MMKNLKEDELEFISVNTEDDYNMNVAYNDHSSHDRSGGNGGNGVIGSWLFNQSKHPVTVFFHLFFKCCALFLYIFGSWFTTNFIFIFVMCILLLAFDFWTVKNISGRLLVGLRWWSYVKEDGSNEWTFESLEDTSEITAFDSRMFWGGLYLTPLAWLFLFIIGLLRLKFEYLPIVIAAVVLSLANIIGYMKCSNSAKARVQSLMESGIRGGGAGGGGALSAALENSTLRNWIFNSLLAVTTNASSSNNQNNNTGNMSV
jgi:hypothetical protein